DVQRLTRVVDHLHLAANCFALDCIIPEVVVQAVAAEDAARLEHDHASAARAEWRGEADSPKCLYRHCASADPVSSSGEKGLHLVGRAETSTTSRVGQVLRPFMLLLGNGAVTDRYPGRYPELV